MKKQSKKINKKGLLGWIAKLFIVVLIIIFFYVAVFGGSLFKDLQSSMDKLFRFDGDPDGVEQVFHAEKKDAFRASDAIIDAYNQVSKDIDKETCFGVFDAPKQSVFLSYSLDISKTDTGMQLMLSEEKIDENTDQELDATVKLPVYGTPATIDDFSPCVVYGDTAEKFYEDILKEGKDGKINEGVDYGTVASRIRLQSYQKINFAFGDSLLKRKEFKTGDAPKILDFYFLFKNKDKICLIPTYEDNSFIGSPCSSPEFDVTDNDCLSEELVEFLQKSGNEKYICEGFKDKIMSIKGT